MNRALIDAYTSQADELKAWIAGLNDRELDAFPVAGTWSVRQLVVHMLDSDLIATHRMRRIAAEELPLLVSYDETLFNKSAAHSAGDLQMVCDLFALNRRWTSAFLRALPEAAFTRAGIHTQRGKVTIPELVKLYIDHMTHHRPFLIEKRRVLGKPM